MRCRADASSREPSQTAAFGRPHGGKARTRQTRVPGPACVFAIPGAFEAKSATLIDNEAAKMAIAGRAWQVRFRGG